MATSHSGNANQGTVKDPEHDGRLKENREAGRTKGTTEASADRSHGHAQESHGKEAQAGSHSEDSDLKSREYTDKDGKVHHHTHTSGQK